MRVRIQSKFALIPLTLFLLSVSGCGGGSSSAGAPAAEAAKPGAESADKAVQWQNDVFNGYHLTKRTQYNADNSVRVTYVYEHDFLTNTSSREIRNADGQVTATSVSYYSTEGYLLHEESYYSDGSLSNDLVYEFVDDRVEKIFGYYSTNEYTYSTTGAVIKRVVSGGGAVVEEANFKLDNHGRPAEKAQTSYYGVEPVVVNTTYQYNDKGQIAVAVSSGQVTYKTTKFSYDEFGNLVESSSFFADGKFGAKTVYEYEKSPSPRVNLSMLNQIIWL